MRNKKEEIIQVQGFSLFEVLVVFIIIAIVFAAAVPLFKRIIKISELQSPHGRFECWIGDCENKGNKDPVDEGFL